MMNSTVMLSVAVCLALLSPTWAQEVEQPSWAPKLIPPPKYVPPHKPHTKLSDLMAKHKGHAEWREAIVDDDLFQGNYISSAPGTKTLPRYHPDTRAWWVVMEGQIRFEIEGQDPFVATKGSMVQAPMQTIYSMETLGDRPALRFEVGVKNAKTLYPQSVQPPKLAGFEWIAVKLNRKPMPYDAVNKPHQNLSELAKDPKYRGSRFIHDDRAVSQIIYGYEKEMGPLNPKDRGHYHPSSSEFWVIMAGQIRYPIEGQKLIIADVGDIVYAPPFTFHAPRYYGPGPSCRLSMNGYANNIAHLRDAEPAH